MLDKLYERPEGTITLHGLGFIQIQTPEFNQRVHVWHPDLPRRRCYAASSVHNHRFGFTSAVLVGTQVNVRWTPIIPAAPELTGSHIGYLHEGARSSTGSRPWTRDFVCNLQDRICEIVPTGQVYTMVPYDYHETQPGGDGKVATLMTKLGEGAMGAHSLCLNGVSPHVEFDRYQWSEDRLLEIVQDVMGDMWQSFMEPRNV